MRYSDMKKAVKLLGKEWNLGKKESGATGDICAWVYLFSILEESERLVVYKEQKKLIGFAGYTKRLSKKHFFRKRFYSFLRKRLYNSKQIKSVEGLHAYERNYAYSPKKFENYFDGEISILLVDEKYRGKGIGKALLLEVFEAAKKDNIKNIQILSDESCNYKFYETCGYQKLYETYVKNKELGKLGETMEERAYIYEKILN